MDRLPGFLIRFFLILFDFSTFLVLLLLSIALLDCHKITTFLQFVNCALMFYCFWRGHCHTSLSVMEIHIVCCIIA